MIIDGRARHRHVSRLLAILMVYWRLKVVAYFVVVIHLLLTYLIQITRCIIGIALDILNCYYSLVAFKLCMSGAMLTMFPIKHAIRECVIVDVIEHLLCHLVIAVILILHLLQNSLFIINLSPDK